MDFFSRLLRCCHPKKGNTSNSIDRHATACITFKHKIIAIHDLWMSFSDIFIANNSNSMLDICEIW